MENTHPDTVEEGSLFIDEPSSLSTPRISNELDRSHESVIASGDGSAVDHNAPVSAPTVSDIHDSLTKQDTKDGSTPQFLLQKFTLYETKTHFYIIGSNARETRFRILEIDLQASLTELNIKETGGAYNRAEIMEVLRKLEASGELNKVLTAWGIMGFIRFTEGYYMLMITKRSCVAMIGGHYVYHIDDTKLIPLAYSGTYRKPDRRSEETRYLTTFQNLDLSKTFYFSYTYNITHTLQNNLIREKNNAFDANQRRRRSLSDYHEMFVWNNALLKPVLDNAFRWYMPVIHGFIDQAKIAVSGRSILVTIIARRSHYFAGARFLKRGVNDKGRVANEVETEQIVAVVDTTSFHDARAGLFNNSHYTSYVQHRGSIPLYWSQDVNNMSPKPPIELNSPDPFFASAALHFDDMFKRYGPMVRVLNLIKTREKNPRETKLLTKFGECIKYLNQFLPKKNKIHYTSWDMSKASKSRDQEVIEFLEKYADDTLNQTGFFHNGRNFADMRVQNGVCRTNCIDCLDRTNAAQSVIGKKVLGYQLHALNIIDDVNIDYDSDAVDLLLEMFHDHGDTIALQYGGSHLVNTMETYRKINQWSSHSRDMIESIRRFYSNSFVDSQRQDAINLFLGNFVWEKGQPMLWDLATDYYLHNQPYVKNSYRRSYIKWWTPCNLDTVSARVQKEFELNTPMVYPSDPEINNLLIQGPLLFYRSYFDNYWNEYYKPRLFSSFQVLFAFNMNSTSRYITQYNTDSSRQLSPFTSKKATISSIRAGNKHLKPRNNRPVPRKTESSTTLGGLFSKKPDFGFFKDRGRNAEKLKNLTDSYESHELKSRLGSLDNGSNQGGIFHGSVSHVPAVLESGLCEKEVNDVLTELEDPSVNDLTQKMYDLYVSYQVEFTIMTSEPITVDHPDYETYKRAISTDETVQNDIPKADSELYQHSYDLSAMGPPKTLEAPDPDLLDPFPYDRRNFSPTKLHDLEFFSDNMLRNNFIPSEHVKYEPKKGELGVGGSEKAVSQSEVDFYNEWVESSTSI